MENTVRAQHLTLTYSQSVANTFHAFVTFTMCNDTIAVNMRLYLRLTAGILEITL